MKDIFAVLKPKGPTSHDIIDEIRKITGVKKVGHAGTLDPLASGVLVIGVGRNATKKLGEIVKKEKEYLATIRLGVVSSTDDEEGQKYQTKDCATPGVAQVRQVIKSFIGHINQVPPVYSAIKIRGKPSHRRVRGGEEVKLESRKVEIKEIEILNYTWPYLKIRVVTGPGVYIRALARDIGEALSVGGYLAELERTRVGEFTKEQTLTLDELYGIHK